MTDQESLELVRKLLKARDDTEVVQLVGFHLPSIDASFFRVTEASARQLEREGKTSMAIALRGLADRMLRMKTLI